MKADLFNGRWRSSALLAMVLLSLCAPVTGCHAQSRKSNLLGKPAPDFQLQGIYDETYTLAQFKGHILVMQFGSSW